MMDESTTKKERELEELRARHEAVLSERESSGDQMVVRIRELEAAREEEAIKRKEAEQQQQEVRFHLLSCTRYALRRKILLDDKCF